ncbi:MAG: hypothetical protein WDZ30_01205 [Cellvibrionaceae bacterium]
MLSTQEYLFGWGMYVLSSVGLMVVWWRITYKLRPLVLRNVLRLSAAVALLVPYPVPGQETFLAPAWVMSFIEGLFYEEYGFSHAGMPLLLAIVLVNILYLVVDIVWQPFWRKRQAAKQGLESPSAEDDDLPDDRRSGEVEPESARKEPSL